MNDVIQLEAFYRRFPSKFSCSIVFSGTLLHFFSSLGDFCSELRGTVIGIRINDLEGVCVLAGLSLDVVRLGFGVFPG